MGNFNYLSFIISILLTLTIHEASHALAAYILGDKTAYHEGRLSLNPFKHLDLYGSLMFLLVNVGWGKPVPVKPENFKNPKIDQAIVAFAGPLSNFILALIITIYISKANSTNSFLFLLREINIALCAFNLLPIPPLDGSKVLAIFMGNYQYYKYELFLQKNLAYILMIFFIDIQFLGQNGIFLNLLGIITSLIKAILLKVV
ncbi:site-2 protease family protein [bacterium]|nr:site-2 protease family protein [bacterium]|tara:strand:+ start:749 stop:1354 length:606 start_codon:yes stop_codon:yes gene_type:complete